MARIPSSGELSPQGSGQLPLETAGSGSQLLQQQLPTFAATEATASLGLSPLPAGLEALDGVVTDTHLLQVGAILGEPSARGALAAREAGGPVGHPDSFYGSADSDEAMSPWELLVSEGNGGVLYWGWRRPLRKGLYMYMTRSVFLGASPAELRAFMMDDAYRVVWDAAINVLRPLPVAAADEPSDGGGVASARSSASGGSSSSSCSGTNAAVEAMAAATAARMSAAGGAASAATAAAADSASSSDGVPAAAAAAVAAAPPTEVLPHESAFLQAMVHFPKPMASRSYVYARRVWPRPSDGGCYCLSRGCAPPPGAAVPPLPGRAVAVEDYASGCVIRAPSAAMLPPEAAAAGPAAEVALVYFEDAHVRPGFANLGIKKGLWPMVQRTEKALRVYQAGAAANTHLQQPLAQMQQPSIAAAGEPAPVAPTMCRSVSVGGVPLQQQQECGAASAAALARSASLQEVSSSSRVAAATAAAAVPCFPLMADGCDLDDDEPRPLADGAQDDEAVISTSSGDSSTITAAPAAAVASPPAAAVASSDDAAATFSNSSSSSAIDAIKAAIDAGGSPHKPAPQQQQQQQAARGGGWAWLSSLGSSVGAVLKQSGQLLAAASLALWRAQAQASFTLPSFEWRLLRWAYHRLAASSSLLLGPGGSAQPTIAAAAAAACGSHHHHHLHRHGSPHQQLARVASHPLADWVAPAGLVGTLARRVALALPSHPLPGDALLLDHGDPHHATDAMPAFGCTCGGCCSGEGATPLSSGSCCSSSLGCCCVLCAATSAGSCSSSVTSAGSSARGLARAGSGSVVRDGSGGRRHRRVVAGLVQAAGVRIARKLQTVLQPQQPHGMAVEGLFDIDE